MKNVYIYVTLTLIVLSIFQGQWQCGDWSADRECWTFRGKLNILFS